ncbi:MAG: hypothetical protein DIU79_15190 [Actinobacteria bacterium]|nr:MAG: hypothetical protein DIU79_15190 [Actinomycetota bacterium]
MDEKRSRSWSGPALALGQLTLMAINLLVTLTLAYAGGLTAVGATAPAVLVFQLTCGVSQRTLAEAALLARAQPGRPACLADCRRAVAAAVLSGGCGMVVAAGAALAVPDVPPWFGVAYAAGIPFAIALDIGRSAGVAAGAARPALVETAVWFTAQCAGMLTFAALRMPLAICVSWAVINLCFVVLAALRPERRPGTRGLLGWLRATRGLLGPATLDALLAGLTPLIALQLTAYVAPAATLGAIRLLQQLFAPLALISITLRRVLVYRRNAADVNPGQALRDGVTAMTLMSAGSLVLGLAVVVGTRLVPAVSFIPVGVALVAAGVEKAALGLSFGTSLGAFIRGDFRALLSARYVMVAVTALAAPLLTMVWHASGYLIGSALGMVVYSLLLLARSRTRTPAATPLDPSRVAAA